MSVFNSFRFPYNPPNEPGGLELFRQELIGLGRWRTLMFFASVGLQIMVAALALTWPELLPRTRLWG